MSIQLPLKSPLPGLSAYSTRYYLFSQPESPSGSTADLGNQGCLAQAPQIIWAGQCSAMVGLLQVNSLPLDWCGQGMSSGCPTLPDSSKTAGMGCSSQAVTSFSPASAGRGCRRGTTVVEYLFPQLLPWCKAGDKTARKWNSHPTAEIIRK